MNLLQMSSMLFSTITIHAYYVNNNFYHHISLLITIMSLLNHQDNPNSYIKIIDRIIAHYTYIQINISDSPIVLRKKPILLVNILLIPTIFISELVFPLYAYTLHFILHLISIGTFHSYLYYLENKN